jgi:hypothetical protein
MTSRRSLSNPVQALLLFIAPFVWAVGMHAVAEFLFPGVVKVDTWRNTTSACSLICAALVLRLTWRSEVAILGKCVISVLGCFFFGAFALTFQVRPMCGSDSSDIGTPVSQTKVASCS